MKKITRRSFIQQAAILGTALTSFPGFFACNMRQRNINKVVVHPNVNNLRVVGITDPNMTRDIVPVCDWAGQNELVISKTVGENIDKLACGLVDTQNPEQAWRAIFVKPPGKSWAETVVAIKTNNIFQQHTRSAVMAKVCHTLTAILGVNPYNIVIYDACHGDSIGRDTPFSGLPEGTQIKNRWGGSTAPTAVPEPWKSGKKKAACLKQLVDDTVDILINIAMCKGHEERFGGFSMTMKNHFGTFSPRPGHARWGSVDYLMAINKTLEIIGAMDQLTGKVLFPRQQLCLIDALWASESGPGGNPTHQPNFLAMGVLSPILDYQVATKFRNERMGWGCNMKTTRRMLTEFGYQEQDLAEGWKIIEV